MFQEGLDTAYAKIDKIQDVNLKAFIKMELKSRMK